MTGYTAVVIDIYISRVGEKACTLSHPFINGGFWE